MRKNGEIVERERESKQNVTHAFIHTQTCTHIHTYTNTITKELI